MSDSADSEPQHSFEAALEQLQSIVHELEEGQIGLETSLVRFEEGVRLLRNCYQILESAEQRIEILTGTDANGNPLTRPFDATATLEAAESATRKPGRRRATAKAAPRVEPELAAPEPAEPDADGQRLF